MRGADRGDRFARAVADMPRQVRDLAAAQVRVYAPRLVDEQYVRRRSMYGEAWPKPVAGNAPMERSGRLRRGYTYKLRVTPTSVSVEIGNVMAYAGPLQSGTARVERRRHLPEGELPREARREIDAIYRRACQVWATRVATDLGLTTR